MIETRICYLCNRQMCKNCTYPTCRHTTDIGYSLNYTNPFLYPSGYITTRELRTNFEKHVVGVKNNRMYVYFEKEEIHDN